MERLAAMNTQNALMLSFKKFLLRVKTKSRESQNKITGEVIKEDIYHPLCHLVRSEEEENYESCGEEGLLFVSADEHSTFVTVLALSLFILFIISLILIVVARC